MSARGLTIVLGAVLLAAPAGAQELTGAPPPEAPVCLRSLGSMTIVDGDRAGWDELDLPAPRALIAAIVQRSRCFTILEPAGSSAEGDARGADYVLVAELDGQAARDQRRSVLGTLGRVLSGRWAGLTRDAQARRDGARALLSLTSVSTAETVSRTEARALDQEPNWTDGRAGFGAASAPWEESEIGRAMLGAYVDAYAQLVTELGGLDPDVASPPAPEGVFRARRTVNVRAGPSTETAILATLPPATLVTPSGRTDSRWWHVTYGDNAEGWIRMDLLEAAPQP